MITRWSYWLRKARRLFSRNEWVARLLGKPVADRDAGSGLILIQIDGLSRSQLETALAGNRLPFLKRLRSRDAYALHELYSGLPATTPAAQGELFYGQRVAVPAFYFREADSRQFVRMYYPPAAEKVEGSLAAKAEGLLQDGSAYCDVYTGGANEAHFCAASAGWGDLLRRSTWLRTMAVLLLYPFSVVRVLALLLVELVVAVGDFLRGLLSNRDWWMEFKFIPARVAVCIIMRELATIGACVDVARGVPVIQVNFLGYDEQAHRRGPSSAFAHWTLKGIDASIRRIANAAHLSHARHYDLWVYSDHGQDATVPFEREFGRNVESAVAEAVQQVQEPGLRMGRDRAMQTYRATWLSPMRWLGKLMNLEAHDASRAADEVAVTALGPLGHVYLGSAAENPDKETIARALVQQAQIPLVLFPTGPNSVRAIQQDQALDLPGDADRLWGSDYPNRQQILDDLVQLCHHPDAGDFVISGWRKSQTTVSFAFENGGHAGFGREETAAFALLPPDAPLPSTSTLPPTSTLRLEDLRRTALHHLGRQPEIARTNTAGVRKTLRLMTYNVHYCIGMDGRLSPARIARIIRQADVDVVALQELDVRRLRSGGHDQAHLIAQQLEMAHHFHPAWQLEEEQYGNAILSRLPIELVKHATLPNIVRKWPFRSADIDEPYGFLQPRGAIWTELQVGGQKVHVINTHLGLLRQERLQQVEALLGPDWLDHPDCHGPHILCGDFNAGPKTPEYKVVQQRLQDAQESLAGHRPLRTWLPQRPLRRIDHVFVSRECRVRHVAVPNSHLIRLASDHLPLIVEIEFT